MVIFLWHHKIQCSVLYKYQKNNSKKRRKKKYERIQGINRGVKQGFNS